MIWNGVRVDMKRFELSREDAHDQNKWRRKVMEQPTNTSLPGKLPLKRVVGKA